MLQYPRVVVAHRRFSLSATVLSAQALFACGFSPDAGNNDAAASDSATDAAPMVLSVCPDDATLLACFLFDGNTIDGSSVNNNPNVSRVGFVQGASADAASFAADSQLSIDMPMLNATDALTIEAWVRRDPTTVQSILADSDGNFAMFVLGDGRIACQALGSLSTETATATVSTTELTHVACSFEGERGWTAYVNGVVDGLPRGGGSLSANIRPLEIGGDAPYAAQAPALRFTGVIDNLLIWSTARTGAQLCATAGLSC